MHRSATLLRAFVVTLVAAAPALYGMRLAWLANRIAQRNGQTSLLALVGMGLSVTELALLLTVVVFGLRG